MLQGSHGGSRMINQWKKNRVLFFPPMSFWENANFVVWPCQNSWFWVWKKFFSITIFKKHEFVSKVAPFILSLNHSKRAFVAFGFFLPQQKLLENAKFQLRKLLFDGVPIIGFEWNFVYRTKIKKYEDLLFSFEAVGGLRVQIMTSLQKANFLQC